MSQLSFHHLIDSDQIQESDLDKLFALADKYRGTNHRQIIKDGDCYGCLLATLFFESSTRTRFSFETAIQRLGGGVITLEQGMSSSVKKGETLEDMGRIISYYADIVVMRHPQIGSVTKFAKYATIPVINAGDGTNQHPTQSLVDTYTIFSEKKRLDNLKIGLVGDLKYGRANHSLLTLLSRYPKNHFVLISHPSLALNNKQKKELGKYGCQITETTDLKSSVADLDVLMVSRVQQERFSDLDEYVKVKDLYCVNKKIVSNSKSDLTILHGLPRVNEIDIEVDDLSQAKYFKQVEYGLYIRMALLALMTK